MPITTYPLNNVDYSAEDVEIYNSTRTSGIYSGDDFIPSANGSDNKITIGPGIGWIQNGKFRGKCICMESTEEVTMPVSDATYPRIDSVVLQFDANANRTDVAIKQGIASSSPIPPDVVKTEALYELHICHVNRPAGSAAISVSDVTDLRLDDTYCGIMADSVTKVDTTAIKSQIYALIAELKETIEGVKEGSAYLMTSGGTMNGSINMNGHELVGLESPTEESSATSKGYVDTEIGSVREIAQSSQSTADTALSNAATAATSAKNAQNTAEAAAAKSWALADGKSIAENTDLHTITNIGNYYCYMSSTVETLKNCPTNSAFTLKIECSTGVGYNDANEYQYRRAELRPFTVDKGIAYCASANTSDFGKTWTWSDWHKVASQDDVEAAKSTADAAMPKAGGTFTGDAVAYSTNRTNGGLRNIEVRATSATGTLQSTNKIIMVRK